MGVVDIVAPKSRIADSVAKAFGILGLENGLILPADHAHGRQLTLQVEPGVSRVDIAVRWNVTNLGDVAGEVGMRFNLQVDSLFGDVSQLIVEADGSMVGSLAGVVGANANYPTVLGAQDTDELVLDLFIPADALLDRQGSVTGFNWWIAETTIRDITNDAVIPGEGRGQARDEIRDWFRVQEVAAVFSPEAAGAPEPTYQTSVFP